MSEGRDDETPDGLFDDYEVDEELEAQWEKEWEEADRVAVAVLRRGLADRIGAPAPAVLAAAASAARPRLAEGGHPFTWVREAADLDPGRLPADDAELLIRCTAATITPEELTSLPDEEEATLMSLEQADWLGAILSAVRAGAGGDASPESLVEGIRSCPEVEDGDELDGDDAELVESAFSTATLAWQALGLVDAAGRLTPLGEWLLPRALARAWNGDFDEPAGDAS